MIFCESGSRSSGAIDALAVFLAQARANGLPVVVAQDNLSLDIKASNQFDFSSFTTTAQPTPDDSVVLLMAHETDELGYGRLRRLVGETQIPCVAFGKFENRQARITAQSRLAYTLSREATVIDLADDLGLPQSDIPIFSAPIKRTPRSRPRVALLFPDLTNENTRAAIFHLGQSRNLDFELLTDGKGKNEWPKISVLTYRFGIWASCLRNPLLHALTYVF
jgi:hypothetical protein